MRLFALLPLFLLLIACQTPGPLDENSPFRFPPPGSRLALKQELTIPAHSAGVLLQSGRVTGREDLNQYHPHCRLEVNDVRDTTQTVTPDEFLVRRAQQEVRIVAQPAIMKAGLGVASDTQSFYVFRTILGLHSPRQPQVRWLTCQRWIYPALGQHLSIREIRQTLAEIFTLLLPAATPGDRQ